MSQPTPEQEMDSPLNAGEVARMQQLVDKIRAALNQLPGDIAAEVTSLLATVEGHLAADPPNAVAAREAFALIRDQFESRPSDKGDRLEGDVDRILKMLGEI